MAEWLQPHRDMKLVEDFAFRDARGFLWRAPKGSVINGASIPKIAWSVIGGPFDDQYRDASVIHDVACDRRQERWEDVHEVFYNAMRASGVGEVKAKVMYAAVYYFGPRWERKRVMSAIPVAEARRRIDEYNSQQPRENAIVAVATNRRTEVVGGGGGGPLASHGEAPRERDVVDISIRVTPKDLGVKESDFDALRAEIEKGNPSLDEIRAFRRR